VLALLLAGCGGPATTPPVTTTTTPAPTLPEDAVLQLYIPHTGELYRVKSDGRYFVGEHQQQPRSKYERGATKVSHAGLERLKTALDGAGFFALPGSVPANDCIAPGTILRNSGRKVTPLPFVVSARDGAQVKTVTGHGAFAAPCTLGPLEPVYRAFDTEALGDWMNE
jgi:hypothetical protein